MFRKERGFTLIELLIVIAVIGILASAILPRFIAFDIEAKEASTKGVLSSLRTALVMYRAKEEDWPPATSGAVLEAALTGSGTSGPYIDIIPLCRVMDDPNNTIEVGATWSAETGSAWFYNTDDYTWQVSCGGTDSDSKYYSDMEWY